MGLSISLALRHVHVVARVVNKIQSGQYVDTRELLGIEGLEGFTWNQCVQARHEAKGQEAVFYPLLDLLFLTYLAVGTADSVTRERPAYAILLLRVVMCHGWLEYNQLFQQHIGTIPVIEYCPSWAPGDQKCRLCLVPCVLSVIALPPRVQLQQPIVSCSSQQPWTGAGHGYSSHICSSWNEGALGCVHTITCSNCFQVSHVLGDCCLQIVRQFYTKTW